MQSPSILKTLQILATAVVVLAGMYWAASILMPVFMAMFIATLLAPINRWFKGRRVPAGLALLLTLGVLVLVALFLVLLVGNSLTALTSSLVSTSEHLSARKAELQAQTAGMDQAAIFEQVLATINTDALMSAMGFVVGAAVQMASNALLIVFVTLFLLAEGPQFQARLLKNFGADHTVTRGALNLVDSTISYFGLRAVVNLFVAGATGLMLWFFNIPYAGLWAVLTFFLSFVPYIGAFFAALPSVVLAFVQGGLGLALVIILMSVIINSLVENLVAPLVMGKGLSVSPTVVFLSFIFWMFILGGAAAFIAMPLTVALMMFLRNFEETRGLAALMEMTPEAPQKT